MARWRRALTTTTMNSSNPKPTAGKHPALRPRLADQHPSGLKRITRASSKVQKPKKKAKPAATSSHQMRTRSRAQEFRLFDLPPEIRSHIYSFAYAEKVPLNLSEITLPSGISPSRQLRAEALPFFFAFNTFKATVRSNWCVFAKHLHTSNHLHYDSSGDLELSPLVEKNDVALPREIVRFQEIIFNINCCCCAHGIQIGTLTLRVQGRTPVIDAKPRDGIDNASVPVLRTMFAGVGTVVAGIRERKVFNGFTADDLVAVAEKFRLERKIDGL